MAEELKIRTRISKGFQVVVPAELRKQYKLGVGDSAYAALMDGMRLAWAFSEAAVSWGKRVHQGMAERPEPRVLPREVPCEEGMAVSASAHRTPHPRQCHPKMIVR